MTHIKRTGDYVLNSDHARIIAARESEIAALKAALELYRADCKGGPIACGTDMDHSGVCQFAEEGGCGQTAARALGYKETPNGG